MRSNGWGRASTEPAFASAHDGQSSGIRQGTSLRPGNEAIKQAIGVRNSLSCWIGALLLPNISRAHRRREVEFKSFRDLGSCQCL